MRDRKAYQAAYYAAHRADILAQQLAFRIANPEALKGRRDTRRQKQAAYAKVYNVSNREKKRAYNRAYYAAHQEEAKAKQRAYREASEPAQRQARDRAYHGARAQTHADLLRAQWRKSSERYRTLRPEKRRDIDNKRRALKRNVHADSVDLKAILKASRGMCGICGEPFDLFGIEFDHIVPLSRGGSHTADNIQATHARCNRVKGAKVG